MVLTSLASALEKESFIVAVTSLVEQADQDFSGTQFDLVAFGRGVDQPTSARLRASFSAQNPAIRFVDGLAPVTALLVKQIKLALSDEGVQEKKLVDFEYQRIGPFQVRIVLTEACQLTIDLYQLDAVHNTQKKTLISQYITAGAHTFQFDDFPDLTSTVNFLVAEAAPFDLAVVSLS